MTESSDHAYVVEYLRRFDEAAATLSRARRAILREEIAEHLRDAIPRTASDRHAAAAIAQFGSPAEVLSSEFDVGPLPTRRNPGRLRTTRWVLAAGAAVTVALVALLLVTPLGARQTTSALPANPVVANPGGTERITTGEAYFEYRAAIDAMERPLPDGAEYPLGVPKGLDRGKTADGDGDGLMEAGAGAVVAHFSWLCAWESEYLSAFEAGDDRRKVDAEIMIAAWAKSDFYAAMGELEGGWVTNVVTPMRYDDPTGVKTDRTQTCAQAGLFNVET